MKEKLKALKNLAYYMAGSYMEYFIGLCISVIIARSLSPSEYGSYAFLVWVSAMGVILINNGVSTAAIKFIAEEMGKKSGSSLVFQELRRIQLKFALSITVLMLAVGIGLQDEIFPEGDLLILLVLIVAIYFRSVYMFYTSVAKGMEKFKYTSLAILFVSPLNLILVIAASVYLPSLEYFIYIYVLVSIIYCLSISYWVRKELQNKVDQIGDLLRERIYKHIKIVSINVILGFIIYKQSELLFLKWLANDDDVAFYNVGFLLASSAMLLVPGIFSGILLPLMSRVGAKRDGAIKYKFVSSTRYLLFLSIPVVIVGILLSELIVNLLYGEEYAASAEVLKFSLLSSGIAIVGNAAQSYFLSSDNQKLVLKIYLVTALANIVLDYILVKNYGLQGAYLGNLLASTLLTFLLITMCQKNLNVRLEYGVFAKLIMAAVIAGLPLWLSVTYFGALLYIVLSVLLFIPVYIGLTLLMNCWSDNDYAFLHFLKRKISKRI